MNKGAAIIICGDVGDEVGTYMLKGDLVIVGNAGYNSLTISSVIRLHWRVPAEPGTHRLVPPADEDIARLRAYFDAHGIQADPNIQENRGGVREAVLQIGGGNHGNRRSFVSA